MPCRRRWRSHREASQPRPGAECRCRMAEMSPPEQNAAPVPVRPGPRMSRVVRDAALEDLVELAARALVDGVADFGAVQGRDRYTLLDREFDSTLSHRRSLPPLRADRGRAGRTAVPVRRSRAELRDGRQMAETAKRRVGDLHQLIQPLRRQLRVRPRADHPRERRKPATRCPATPVPVAAAFSCAPAQRGDGARRRQIAGACSRADSPAKRGRPSSAARATARPRPARDRRRVRQRDPLTDWTTLSKPRRPCQGPVCPNARCDVHDARPVAATSSGDKPCFARAPGP